MVEGAQEGVQEGVVLVARFDGEGALRGGGHHDRWVEHVGGVGVKADAPQPGKGENDRVEALTRAEGGGRGARVGTQVEAAHAREPRGDVAVQVGARGEHLGGAPGRARADKRALRQGCQSRPVGCAQGVAGVFTLRDGSDAQPRRGGGGQVLEGVNGQVALSPEEGEPQLSGEHADATERGQGLR